MILSQYDSPSCISPFSAKPRSLSLRSLKSRPSQPLTSAIKCPQRIHNSYAQLFHFHTWPYKRSLSLHKHTKNRSPKLPKRRPEAALFSDPRFWVTERHPLGVRRITPSVPHLFNFHQTVTREHTNTYNHTFF
jgi:hypothetical protein